MSVHILAGPTPTPSGGGPGILAPGASWLWGIATDKANEAVDSAFDDAMKEVWNWAGSALAAVFGFIDHLTTPNLDVQHGPLAGIIPLTTWLGGAVAVLVGFIQICRALINRILGRTDEGLVRLAIGLAQYAVISGCGIGILDGLVGCANQLATAILHAGLHVDSWKGVTTAHGIWLNQVDRSGGAGLGIVAFLCIIPAAFGFAAEELVRDGAILILSATIPILAAGLLSTSTRKWFWTGLQWAISLIILPPTVALVMSIGFKIASGMSSGTTHNGHADGAGSTMVGLIVGGLVLLLSMICPLFLFKLMAFVDPGTGSGQALRGWLDGFGGGGKDGSGGGGSDTPDFEKAADSRFDASQSGNQTSSPDVSDDAAERSGTGRQQSGAPPGGGQPGGQGPTGGDPSADPSKIGPSGVTEPADVIGKAAPTGGRSGGAAAGESGAADAAVIA